LNSETKDNEKPIILSKAHITIIDPAKDAIPHVTIPPPPPDELAPPPDPPEERFQMRVSVGRQLNEFLIDIGGSKWMRGKVLAFIGELYRQGKLGGGRSSGAKELQAIWKERPKSKQSKPLTKREAEIATARVEVKEELAEALKERRKKLEGGYKYE
jgi:hypothetical protein